MPTRSEHTVTGGVSEVTLDLAQVQGLVLRNYKMGFAKYLFYGWDTSEKGRKWLEELLSLKITYCSPWPSSDPDRALNVAVTFKGLQALRLSPNSLATFPGEFKSGMAKRASILGDYGKSAPTEWEEQWRSLEIHGLVVIHGQTSSSLEKLASTVTQALLGTGATKLFQQDARALDGGKEHFGFKDGISQPWVNVAGLHEQPDMNVKGGGKWTSKGWAPLEAGEFVLGYNNESGLVAAGPSPEALGRNGSYVVVRKMGKDVDGFLQHMKKQAERIWPGDPGGPERLGALMMGRSQEGKPVDNPGTVNDFHYTGDPSGSRCPLGAHIRRTNPRENVDLPGALGSHRHRIIRRGLEYGDPGQATGDRGSMFIAVCASIQRQFEFLQQFWVNDGEFLGLDRDERDPFIGSNRDSRDRKEDGSHPEQKRKFTMPGRPDPFVFSLPEFVTIRGGEYFFAPGRTALEGLAEGKFSHFRTEQ